MGRGRPRKPIEELLRNGTYRADRHGPLPDLLANADGGATANATVNTAAANAATAAESLAVSSGVDEPGERLPKPSQLTGRAAEIWRELAGLLQSVLRRRDQPALAELCRWVARSERIAETLDAMEPTRKEYRQLLTAAAVATGQVTQLTARFGLSPADRSKVRGALIAAASTATKSKVASRPSTDLDRRGKPTGSSKPK